MFPPAEGEWESERAIQFIPRKQWEAGGRLTGYIETSGEIETASDIEEGDDDAFYSLPSDTQDNDSIYSFLSILDENHHIETTYLPFGNIGIKRNSFASKGLSYLLPSTTSHTPKTSGQDIVREPHRARVARGWETDFTIPTEMEHSFFRTSRIAHQIRSETEQRFHRYIDHLEAEMLRGRPNPPEHNIDEEALDENYSVTKIEEQQHQPQEKHWLPAIPESPPVSGVSSIADEPFMPFNTELALARQRKARGEAVKCESNESLHLTPERAMYPSPKSIWPSPSPIRLQSRGTGAQWIMVPAASESGDVWEEFDEALLARNKNQQDEDGKVSIFTAQEEDLEDENSPSGAIKEVSKSKRCWIRCKNVLKRMLTL